MAHVGLTGSPWHGRRVLLTGHTGFKGAWLRLWLEALGAVVTGVSLPPEPDSMYEALGGVADARSRIADIRDPAAIRALAAEAGPEVVMHLAAQAFVRRSYSDPVGTFASNVSGTLHVLDAARAARSVRAVVVVTSDKVYENDGSGRAFREDDPLGGEDPYSASKAAAELAVRSWRSAHHAADDPVVATARAGNVIGGGDAGVDRLVPDAIRAVSAGRPLRLRHPESTRPWQFVLEPLYGYLLLAEALLERRASAPAAVNFGPAVQGIRTATLVDLLFERWGSGTWETDPGPHPAEAPTLRIDPTLAAETLGWRPVVPTEEALDLTVAWHRASAEGRDLRAISVAQIEAYTSRLVGAVGVG
jgi:CDP-glucose 4,6-dehydratase